MNASIISKNDDMKTNTKRRQISKSTKLSDQVYQDILNKILYGVWAAGYHALEQELAETLKVSRTPIREALIRLQRDGLIKVIPRHGMIVLPISLTDIQETHELLTSLESLAVQRAATRQLSQEELERLDRSMKIMDEAYQKSDIKVWAAEDEDFHRLVVELSGNRILIDVVNNFWFRARRARHTMLSMRTDIADSIKEHALLIEAIRNGESAKAREILENHRVRGIKNLNMIMEQRREILQF